MKRLLKLFAALTIGIVAFSSCIQKEDEVNIDDDNYQFFFYAYVPSFTGQTSVTKEQEGLFNIFCEIYKQRLQNIPNYTSLDTENYFKIYGKTLYNAVDVVGNDLANNISKDIEEWSNRMSTDLMKEIDFYFVVSIGYIASDTTVGYFYSKAFGSEYYVKY